MKKCKVTLATKARQKNFYLAPDAETLYILTSTKPIKNHDSILKDHPDIEMVTLNSGEWLEVEWNGCQNIADGKNVIRTNFVRLIKISKLSSGDDSDALISLHFGWLLSDHLRFINHRRNGVRVKVLNKKDEQYNFSDLFQDNQTIEDLFNEGKPTEIN